MFDDQKKERRNRIVRLLIHEKALELAQDRPAAAITAEDIAEAAGISRRTFFNYCPTKNHAFIPDISDTDPQALADFCEDQSISFLEAIERLLIARHRDRAPHRSRIKQAQNIWKANPELQRLAGESIKGLTEQFQSAVAKRIGISEEEPQTYALAMTMVALERAVINCSHSGPPNEEEMQIRQSVHGVGEIITGMDRRENRK